MTSNYWTPKNATLVVTASILLYLALRARKSKWPWSLKELAPAVAFPKSRDFTRESVAQVIVRRALSEKDRVYAVDANGKSITYDEFFRRSFFLGRALRRLCGEGSNHIAVIMENCIEYLLIFAACALWDLVICPVNFTLSVDEKKRILRHLDATIVITEDLEPWHTIILRKRDLASTIDAEAAQQVIDPYDLAIERWDRWSKCGSRPWMILSTSGTSTGNPKGVVRSQDSSVSGFDIHTRVLGFTKNTTALISWPLHSISSAFFAFNYLEVGMKVVLQKGIAPETFDDTFAKHTINFLAMPSATALQINIPRCVSTILLSGTMANNEALKLKIRKARVFDAYGSTEAGLVLLSDNKMNLSPAFPDSVRLVPLPNGLNEITTKTPMMFTSYWRNRTLDAASFSDGYFLTGDIGEWSGRYVRVLGRKDDMLALPSGQKIFPAELENVLGECVVLGVPSNGDAQKLVCVFDQGEEKDFRKCAEKLGANRRPHEYRKVSKLPRTATGKIIRTRVRDNFL